MRLLAKIFWVYVVFKAKGSFQSTGVSSSRHFNEYSIPFNHNKHLPICNAQFHYEVFSQGSTNLQTHEDRRKDQRKDQRSCLVFCLFKTQNNVAVNNFYSGVTAGAAAIYLWVCIFGDPRLEYFVMELCIA